MSQADETEGSSDEWQRPFNHHHTVESAGGHIQMKNTYGYSTFSNSNALARHSPLAWSRHLGLGDCDIGGVSASSEDLQPGTDLVGMDEDISTNKEVSQSETDILTPLPDNDNFGKSMGMISLGLQGNVDPDDISHEVSIRLSSLGKVQPCSETTNPTLAGPSQDASHKANASSFSYGNHCLVSRPSSERLEIIPGDDKGFATLPIDFIFPLPSSEVRSSLTDLNNWCFGTPNECLCYQATSGLTGIDTVNPPFNLASHFTHIDGSGCLVCNNIFNGQS